MASADEAHTAGGPTPTPPETIFTSTCGDDESKDNTGTATVATVDPIACWFTGKFVRVRDGGIKFCDKAAIKKQKGVVADVLRNFSASVLSGASVVSLSLPVRIFEPATMLQRCALAWQCAPVFLPRAAAAVGADEALERFKLVAAFAVSGLHFCCYQLKPFNPILGETFQAVVGDGAAEVYMEHSSHHPPIANFQVLGRGDAFLLHGVYTFIGGMKGNSVENRQEGFTAIRFPDGCEIRYEMPFCKMRGVIMGDRVVEWLGRMTFTDERNALAMDLKFDPKPFGLMKKRKGCLPSDRSDEGREKKMMIATAR